MNRYGFDIFDVRLTPQARQLLRPGEALVFDWHRMAFCCAGAGEMSLYAMREEKARGRKGLVHLFCSGTRKYRSVCVSLRA